MAVDIKGYLEEVEDEVRNTTRLLCDVISKMHDAKDSDAIKSYVSQETWQWWQQHWREDSKRSQRDRATEREAERAADTLRIDLLKSELMLARQKLSDARREIRSRNRK